MLTSAAVLGLTDVDALTVSMARGVAKTVSLEAAALAIAVGVLANTAVKLGVALFFGSARFRAIARTRADDRDHPLKPFFCCGDNVRRTPGLDTVAQAFRPAFGRAGRPENPPRKHK